MCSSSLHLFIGALLVLAVENEAKTTMISNETTTLLISMSIDNTTILNITSNDFLNNFTTPEPNVSLSSTTDVNTSDYKSDLPTTFPSEHPQTENVTLDDPRKNDPQPSTKKTPTRAPSTVENYGKTTKASETGKSYGQTYIIILIIIVVCISGVIIYCCLQKKSRRYSVDLHPKQEDAHIPLSTVDAEVFDTTSVKDMQTFTAVESTEPLKDPDPVKENPEGGKESVDVKQENQQNLSNTQATVIPKDKMEELTVVDLTDVEPTISTKTSMESLDDALNENNSNNTRAEVNGKVHKFTEIPLDGLL
ncbi:uncharacterized protein si:dkey-27h10.2 [Pseudorasbora parva]|uniref:uncharacterized protein si:dkey-27h10.2 n=1 Tax=Pseudorasbora parva TaxID=51549 RepID=UPI00351F5DB9